MVKINVYDGENRVMESVDTSDQPVLNDPNCTHPDVMIVEDNSGIQNVTAYQCKVCSVGWLVRDKIKDKE